MKRRTYDIDEEKENEKKQISNRLRGGNNSEEDANQIVSEPNGEEEGTGTKQRKKFVRKNALNLSKKEKKELLERVHKRLDGEQEITRSRKRRNAIKLTEEERQELLAKLNSETSETNTEEMDSI